VKKILFPLILLLTACSTTYRLPGNYAVVVAPELATRWETERVVSGLRQELQHVEVLDAAPALNGYDAVVRLGVENVRGASVIGYEILSPRRDGSGRIAVAEPTQLVAAGTPPANPVGRTERDIISRAHREDYRNIAKAQYNPGITTGAGQPMTWEAPPAGRLEQLARVIARDLRELR